MTVGVSILTNGARCAFLRSCIDSFLSGCYYRPLVIGVLDNGSTDDTPDFLSRLPKVYGVTWRPDRSPVDLGCAAGTNSAHKLVHDCEFVLHLESDFRHLAETESGIDRLWLHRAVEFMNTGRVDYLYLRRMRSDKERALHWFDQWKGKIIETEGPYQRCENFWWSNNPSLFRMKSLLESKTLPLDEKLDGPKGTSNWSKPELLTSRPPKAWLYGFGAGMFVHDG